MFLRGRHLLEKFFCLFRREGDQVIARDIISFQFSAAYCTELFPESVDQHSPEFFYFVSVSSTQLCTKYHHCPGNCPAKLPAARTVTETCTKCG